MEIIKKIDLKKLDKEFVKRFCYEYYLYRFNDIVNNDLMLDNIKMEMLNKYNTCIMQLNYGYISVRECMLMLSEI